ncbi:MAG: hypothetical protein WAM14_04085 [Candidatus Nitrosopolaris sp.]
MSDVQPPLTKTCKTCKTSKLLSEYDHSNRSKDLRRSVCKECYSKKGGQRQTRRDVLDCYDCTLFTAGEAIMKLILDRIYNNKLIIPEGLKEIVLETASAILEDEEYTCEK